MAFWRRIYLPIVNVNGKSIRTNNNHIHFVIVEVCNIFFKKKIGCNAYVIGI